MTERRAVSGCSTVISLASSALKRQCDLAVCSRIAFRMNSGRSVVMEIAPRPANFLADSTSLTVQTWNGNPASRIASTNAWSITSRFRSVPSPVAPVRFSVARTSSGVGFHAASFVSCLYPVSQFALYCGISFRACVMTDWLKQMITICSGFHPRGFKLWLQQRQNFRAAFDLDKNLFAFGHSPQHFF